MKTLIVFCHPRRESFTGALADSFVAGLTQAGDETEFADLHAEKFDPITWPEDEPDWNDGTKRYSDAVLAEQARVDRNEAIVLIFPVWWWSVPAMLKGWIDRVWNNGWAYGDRKLPHRKGLLVGVAAGSAASYAKRGYDSAIDTQLREGVMRFCGIADSELVLIHDSLDDGTTREAALARLRALGQNFAAGATAAR